MCSPVIDLRHASFTYTCAAIFEPCDGSVRIAARRVTVDVLRNKGRIHVEVYRVDNEDVVYFDGELAEISYLGFSNFSKSQIAGIRRKIAAVLA